MVNPATGEGTETEEPFHVTDYSFDTKGNLTYYNGTGAEPSTRMLGVDLNYFQYTYDEQGRMRTIAVYTLGTTSPTVYNISYDEQERYIPLPFPLGEMNLFCVKGVKQIIGPSGNISEWKSDNTFVHTQIVNAGSLFETRTKTVYTYKDTETLFPESATVTTYTNEELESTENIHYQWNEKVLYSFPSKNVIPLTERWKCLSLLVTAKPCRLHQYLSKLTHKVMLRKSPIVTTVTVG